VGRVLLVGVLVGVRSVAEEPGALVGVDPDVVEPEPGVGLAERAVARGGDAEHETGALGIDGDVGQLGGGVGVGAQAGATGDPVVEPLGEGVLDVIAGRAGLDDHALGVDELGAAGDGLALEVHAVGRRPVLGGLERGVLEDDAAAGLGHQAGRSLGVALEGERRVREDQRGAGEDADAFPEAALLVLERHRADDPALGDTVAGALGPVAAAGVRAPELGVVGLDVRVDGARRSDRVDLGRGRGLHRAQLGSRRRLGRGGLWRVGPQLDLPFDGLVRRRERVGRGLDLPDDGVLDGHVLVGRRPGGGPPVRGGPLHGPDAQGDGAGHQHRQRDRGDDDRMVEGSAGRGVEPPTAPPTPRHAPES
jgi:hypothetical protein